MRSVFVYVKDATKESVVSCLPTLKNIHTSRIGLPWIYNIEGETYLYVDVNDEPASEYEAEEWQEIVAQFGEVPKVEITVDVSGRHPGDKQVQDFVESVLNVFTGAALDEYTLHLWTIEEIKAKIFVNGHPFFDYNGWYTASENQV